MDANLQFTIYNVKWLVCSGSRLDVIDSQCATEFAGLVSNSAVGSPARANQTSRQSS